MQVKCWVSYIPPAQKIYSFPPSLKKVHIIYFTGKKIHIPKIPPPSPPPPPPPHTISYNILHLHHGEKYYAQNTHLPTKNFTHQLGGAQILTGQWLWLCETTGCSVGHAQWRLVSHTRGWHVRLSGGCSSCY